MIRTKNLSKEGKMKKILSSKSIDQKKKKKRRNKIKIFPTTKSRKFESTALFITRRKERLKIEAWNVDENCEQQKMLKIRENKHGYILPCEPTASFIQIGVK